MMTPSARRGAERSPFRERSVTRAERPRSTFLEERGADVSRSREARPHVACEAERGCCHLTLSMPSVAPAGSSTLQLKATELDGRQGPPRSKPQRAYGTLAHAQRGLPLSWINLSTSCQVRPVRATNWRST